MGNKRYTKRYISYIKKWQNYNIQLKDKIEFLAMSVVQANIDVPLVESTTHKLKTCGLAKAQVD